jgi:hypothetical protein
MRRDLMTRLARGIEGPQEVNRRACGREPGERRIVRPEQIAGTARDPDGRTVGCPERVTGDTRRGWRSAKEEEQRQASSPGSSNDPGMLGTASISICVFPASSACLTVAFVMSTSAENVR